MGNSNIFFYFFIFKGLNPRIFKNKPNFRIELLKMHHIHI